MTSATTFSTKNPPDSGGGPGAATDGKPRDRCAEVALADEGRILLVDDADAVLRALARELGAAGRRVDRCADPREAVQRLARDESAWIVFDDRMPDLSGIALMEPVWRLAAETLRFLLTAHPDLDSAVRATTGRRAWTGCWP
jgi:DNA-binding NtrC family response regulator